ncbi:MAG: zinc ABC transporter substrate-binding protein [Solirubrobacterales bacterium]|nr:zinc ABC transporter substrate-binding protein [Solirubrobacterales bacterium]
MRKVAMLAVLLCLVVGGGARAQSGERPLSIVAAENFYGDVAQQLAGPHAAVTSILSNPDEDPHLFEASPSVARALSAAKIVAYNGADYDPWMARLLGATTVADRRVIVVADLVGKKAGDNPHLWYDLAVMPAYARVLSAGLAAADPANKAEYDQRLQRFLDSLKLIDAKVAELRRKYAGTPVTATEPVFGYMAASLGLVMRNERFQLAVMNNTEPSASDVAALESDLRQHRVKLFIYNSQATDTAARRLLRIAEQSKVPIIGVTETEPKGKDYQQWMLGQLDALDKAMSGRTG